MQRLEPYEGKLSRTVLRGGIGSNVNLLPDQILKNKSEFINQIITSKTPARRCDDVDEVTLSYAEVMALCAGSPLIKEKIDLEVDVVKLRSLQSEHNNQQYRLESQVKKGLLEQIRMTEKRTHSLEDDVECLKNQSDKFFSMTVSGADFRDKEEAGKALIEVCQKMKPNQTVDIGSYKGFDMSIHYDSWHNDFNLYLKREDADGGHKVTLCKTPKYNMEHIDAELSAIPHKLTASREQFQALQNNLETAKNELGKPFPQEAELNTKTVRLFEVNTLLESESKEQSEASKIPPQELKKAADRLPTNLDKQDKSSLSGRLKNATDTAAHLNENREKRGKSAKNRDEEL